MLEAVKHNDLGAVSIWGNPYTFWRNLILGYSKKTPFSCVSTIHTPTASTTCHRETQDTGLGRYLTDYVYTYLLTFLFLEKHRLSRAVESNSVCVYIYIMYHIFKKGSYQLILYVFYCRIAFRKTWSMERLYCNLLLRNQRVRKWAYRIQGVINIYMSEHINMSIWKVGCLFISLNISFANTLCVKSPIEYSYVNM